MEAKLASHSVHPSPLPLVWLDPPTTLLSTAPSELCTCGHERVNRQALMATVGSAHAGVSATCTRAYMHTHGRTHTHLHVCTRARTAHERMSSTARVVHQRDSPAGTQPEHTRPQPSGSPASPPGTASRGECGKCRREPQRPRVYTAGTGNTRIMGLVSSQPRGGG